MFSSPPPAVRYHGLLNQGATCYLNSVLQVLFMTDDFREAVERHCCENRATECIDCQLKALFDDLKEQTAYTYNITRKLGISRVYEQQDAAEYYEKILNLTSPDASQIFHGWLTDRTTCSGCGTETDTDGAFWHLPLALVDSYSEHYSVVDGIKEHFRASEFSGENQMYCEECDTKCDATIQCVMKHHPEVLMLLLKRFDFDYSNMKYVKINQTVDVPRILQIPENQTYELYAVVDHSGDLRSGHYSVSIWDDENWFTFNDSRVILADYQPFQVDNFEQSRSAYLLFYRKQNATQTTRPVSAPGGHLPATSDVYDQCQDLGEKRGREEGEAINRDEETEGVQSGVELQSDLRHNENDQDTITHIHQVCDEERNDKNHLQDAQADEHRDGVEILTGVKEGKGGNAEAENQAEEMEPCRVTQREESADDQGSREESAQDVSDDLKPEIRGVLAKDADLRKEVEGSDEETGEIDVKTGEDKQSEEEENSFTSYREDNARGNIEENLRGTQEVGQDYDLKPVSEDEQREQRRGRNDDKEEKTKAGERRIASGIGKQNHDNERDGSSKQSMPKHDHEHRVEMMNVQEVEEQKRGYDKDAKSKDTSVTERYPSEGVQAQDSDKRGDVSVHPEHEKQKDVELDKKGKTGVSDKGIGSRPTKLLTKHSSEIQDDIKVDDNKVSKVDQRCKEGGSSRRKGHQQEREGRKNVKGVMVQKRGNSEHSHFLWDVEDQSFVEFDDRQRMSEQNISGKCRSHKDVSAETQSKHIQNRSDFSLKRAASAGSSKPTASQGAGRGEKVRRSKSQERPSWKCIEVKNTDGENRSETVPRSSVFSDLSRAGSAGSSKPAECQGAGGGEKARRSNPQLKSTLERRESTREERLGFENIEITTPDIESIETRAGHSAWGNLSKIFTQSKRRKSSHTKPKKHASKKPVRNAQQDESNSRNWSKATNKQKLPDTENQKKKKGCRFWNQKWKKKQREKEKKHKTTTGCFSFKRQENSDSD